MYNISFPGAEPVMENFFGSRALKKLVGRGQGSGRAASEARKVAAKLWESSMKGKCKVLSSSHAAKARTQLVVAKAPGFF